MSSSARPSDSPSARASDRASDGPSRPASRAHLPKEEPDFVNEADIPSADDEPRRSRPGAPDAPRKADVAGVESAAGEEDPGAALDTPPTPSPTRNTP